MKSPDPRKGLHLLPPQTVRVQTWVRAGSTRLSVFSSCLLLSVCHCQQLTGLTTVNAVNPAEFPGHPTRRRRVLLSPWLPVVKCLMAGGGWSQYQQVGGGGGVIMQSCLTMWWPCTAGTTATLPTSQPRTHHDTRGRLESYLARSHDSRSHSYIVGELMCFVISIGVKPNG